MKQSHDDGASVTMPGSLAVLSSFTELSSYEFAQPVFLECKLK